ncbi:AAA family ATPase [Holdemania filiformis]|uniref:AAA family ATPase n=1 Tax=Holdemania filiformis TaxID=61171 RepID=UPI0026769E76|nr:ATP-binding protein [Holdemania filiformis]
MIVEVRLKNCLIFSDEIQFSLKADMRNKKFSSNVHQENGFNVLKTVGIYGPNNAGKTCLIQGIREIKNTLSNEFSKLGSNIFSESSISEAGIRFLNRGREFDYEFHYDSGSEEYPYEKFVEILKDSYGNEKEHLYFLRDIQKQKFICEDKKLEEMLPMISKSNILIYLVDPQAFNLVNETKTILTDFASKIDVIDMNNIPLNKTVQLMKGNSKRQKKVVEFIKNADLDMDDFVYLDEEHFRWNLGEFEKEKPEEKALDIPEQFMEQIRLCSVYHGVPLPSVLFDSTGTKKIAALASYIIEALEDGRVLVIDELDSSLHFKLTRAIAAMFNNELNRSAQLIFTVHDINLLDCKKLFRKEQIWFIDKDQAGVYLYSLADFTALKGVRDNSDILSKYQKGIFGAVPEPELIKSLLDLDIHTRNQGE